MRELKMDKYLEDLNDKLKKVISIQGRRPTFDGPIDRPIHINQTEFQARQDLLPIYP